MYILSSWGTPTTTLNPPTLLAFSPSDIPPPQTVLLLKSWKNYMIQTLNLKGFEKWLYYPKLRGSVIQETKILSHFLEAELGGCVIHESCYTRDFTVLTRSLLVYKKAIAATSCQFSDTKKWNTKQGKSEILETSFWLLQRHICLLFTTTYKKFDNIYSLKQI